MTAEDKARERGLSAEYAEAVRQVRCGPVQRRDRAALADFMGVRASCHCARLAAAEAATEAHVWGASDRWAFAQLFAGTALVLHGDSG